ncbi:TetR/AcrR family transcriptional regulator [Phenylobacterium sp.]|jgi:AcrR family transcriptional regulator|uniref:TetR/AcrR family transcriptional regulator n=1 Tax=Phenylobacterium sp. TaxID=1871053 RepID=UPI0037C56F42
MTEKRDPAAAPKSGPAKPRKPRKATSRAAPSKAAKAKTAAKPPAGRKAGGLVIDNPDLGRPRVASGRARQIFVQAARLFVEKGYDGASMSDIAEAVNITKAGLYHFVKSKEDLLYTLVSFGMDELEDEVVNPGRAEPDPAVRLRLMIRNHVANIGRVGSSQGNPVTIVTDDITGLSPRSRRLINSRKRAYYTLVRDTLEELKVRGDAAADLDTTVAAHSLIGAILWTGRWRRPNGRLGVDELVEHLTAFVLKGVLAR